MRPLTSARLMRILFGAAALLAVGALLLDFTGLQRRGSIDWPMTLNVFGVLVLAATGAFDPPPGKLRLALSAIALALIVPTAFIILTR